MLPLSDSSAFSNFVKSKQQLAIESVSEDIHPLLFLSFLCLPLLCRHYPIVSMSFAYFICVFFFNLIFLTSQNNSYWWLLLIGLINLRNHWFCSLAISLEFWWGWFWFASDNWMNRIYWQTTLWIFICKSAQRSWCGSPVVARWIRNWTVQSLNLISDTRVTA